MKKKYFNEVYPFATENVKGYMERLDLKDKNVLTLGSSCDQAFNALVCDAGKVTIFDINPDMEKYYIVKRDVLDISNRKDFIFNMFSVMDCNLINDLYGFDINFSKDEDEPSIIERSNNYLSSDYNYDKLRERLNDNPIDFIVGDVFNAGDYLNNKYDFINLSNVMDYLYLHLDNDELNMIDKDVLSLYKEISEIRKFDDTFRDLYNYLEEDGKLLLLYLFDFNENNSIHLCGDLSLFEIGKFISRNINSKDEIYTDTFSNLLFEGIHDNTNDAAIIYTKKGIK